MPTFRPPSSFGSRDVNQHVYSPAQHLGYRYLVAYFTDGGCTKDYILKACAEAHDDGAPKDVVCHDGAGWKRRSELNPVIGRRLDTYARALTTYEQELKAEQKQEAGW